MYAWLPVLFFAGPSAEYVMLVWYYIAYCLYLRDSYITKFDLMNYAFAKLIVAWL